MPKGEDKTSTEKESMERLYVIDIIGPFLCYPPEAEKLKNRIYKKIRFKSSEPIILSFSKVKVMLPDFIAQVVEPLVEELGYEHFREKVIIKNAEDQINYFIQQCFKRARAKEKANQSDSKSSKSSKRP
jgi:hypothetical protein